MKRTLSLSTTVAGLMALAAAVLFFAACESPVNPSDVTTTEGVLAVRGPEWVNAKAYPGANLITWAFVKDANAYSVYRQRSDGSDALIQLYSSNSQGIQGQSFSYVDKVGFENQLVHDVDYVYYVTANSGQGITGRAVSAPDVTIINDGASSTVVRANIPKREEISDVTKLVPEGIESLVEAKIVPEKVKNSRGEDELLLTWPHDNPGFKYTVNYDLGTIVTLNHIVPAAPVGSSVQGGDITRYYRAPLFGGSNTVKITVGWSSDEYYYKPATLSKPLPAYALTTLSAVSSFSVVRNGTSAIITWDPGDGLKDTNYKVYRIKANRVSQGPQPINGSIEVVGEWEKVNGTPVVSKDEPDPNNGFNILGKYVLIDTDLSYTQGYLYAVYAETDSETKSKPVLFGLPAEEIGEDLELEIEPTFIVDANGNRKYSVTIRWEAQTGVTTSPTYKLQKALLTRDPIKVGDLEPVPAAPVLISGRYTVVDTPAIRNSYVYVLTVDLGGGITRTFEKFLTEYPFIDSVNFGISVAQSTTYAYATTVTIVTDGQYANDLVVDIYRAEGNVTAANDPDYYNSAGDLNFRRITENYSLKDTSYEDTTGLTIGTKYVYRYEVKTAGTPSKVLFNKNKNGYVQTPSVGSIGNVSFTGNDDTRYYFRVSNFLKGSKVQLQQRKNNANVNDSWSTRSESEVITIAPGSRGPDGSNLNGGESYFSFTPKPSATDLATYDYRIVLVNQPGNVALTEYNAPFLLRTSDWTNWYNW